MNPAFSDLEFFFIVSALIFTLAALNLISRIQRAISKRIVASKIQTNGSQKPKNTSTANVRLIGIKKATVKEMNHY